MKNQGGRWICTDPTLDMLSLRHIPLGNLIHQLPWPNVLIPVVFTYKL